MYSTCFSWDGGTIFILQRKCVCIAHCAKSILRERFLANEAVHVMTQCSGKEHTVRLSPRNYLTCRRQCQLSSRGCATNTLSLDSRDLAGRATIRRQPWQRYGRVQSETTEGKQQTGWDSQYANIWPSSVGICLLEDRDLDQRHFRRRHQKAGALSPLAWWADSRTRPKWRRQVLERT